MGFLNKKIYDVNYSWKEFELKKNEITMAAYKEIMKLKDLIEPKKVREKWQRNMTD